MSVVAAVPAKEWLVTFRILRRVGGAKIPDGRPLFGYHVTGDEYSELAQVLTEGFADRHSPIQRSYWYACFCLYVAESFRRNYDASEGGWSWNGFERALGISLTPSQRSEAVEEGLVKYWGRPIRRRTAGRDILGSLFSEGGLPWKLVQHDHHGFGRAVRAGLKNFYENRDAGRSTAEFLGDYLASLPQSFRNTETRQLLAGIVEQLVALVENHPITDEEDPASYLDKHEEAWRHGFPIPLGEENGKRLVNDWLRRADRSRGERQQKAKAQPSIACRHWLDPDHFYSQALITEITLSKTLCFTVNPSSLRSTRLELGFYEGETLLHKAGALYGQLIGEGEEGLKLSVNFPRQYYRLSRRQYSLPLKLAFLANGQEIYAETIAESAVAFSEVPLLFERDDQGWVLSGDGSCRFAAEEALLWVPLTAELEGEGAIYQHQDSHGRWLTVTNSIQVRLGEELYRFSPGMPGSKTGAVQLKGRVMLDKSLPGSVYRGWPQLTLDTITSKSTAYSRYINGKRVVSESAPDRYGAFRYKVANSEGETILLRRFGVLPEDITLSSFPAYARTPAQVRVKTSANLQVRVSGEGIDPCKGEFNNGAITAPLEYRGANPPAKFRLSLCSDGEAPVELELDFPFEGVRFISASGEEDTPTELLLEELLGSQLVLTNGAMGQQVFNIQLQLAGSGAQIHRYYSVVACDRPVALSLFAFTNDIRQILGATGDQDSYIRFSIDSQQPLMRFDIRRFNGRLEREGHDSFRLQGARATRVGEPRKAEIMLLSDPAMKPIELEETTTCGVGMGAFELPAKIKSDGPWLIYPKPGAADQFRPVLVPRNQVDTQERDIHSLHAAAKAFHPRDNPAVIDSQIQRMAEDLSHSGWSYLEELLENFDHLPLSTFEAWKALARNLRTLALATLRLNLDEAKALRFQEELSIIWEYIPLSTWRTCYQGYSNWIKRSGVPQTVVDTILTQRSQILESLISGYREVLPYIQGGGCGDLKRVATGELLRHFFQELRRNHTEVDSWPNYLGSSLRRWVLAKQVDSQLYDYSNTHETNALAYLPVFLGYVTAGLAKPEDLEVSPDFMKFAIRAIADFDRQGWFIPAHASVTTYLMTE
ncbi:STY4851/ECs_5259 family protein [Microbulbifer sp. EKSA008]|uniref:STY4851/ECs_5259 family protein n=1 Tax=Microbulbifer sp. EKSA008 TaxID=3243367 RepID=UPI00404366B3